MINLPVVEGRSCDGCTKCCEGYLAGEIQGKQMGFGKPCFLVEIGKGCNDYENRPEIPCKAFQCEWLINESIPEDLKPSTSNLIISRRFLNEKISYIEFVEAGSKLDSEVLSWAIENSLANDVNIVWTIAGNIYWLGDDEFCDAIENMIDMQSKGIEEIKKEQEQSQINQFASFYPPKYDPMQSTKIDLTKFNENTP